MAYTHKFEIQLENGSTMEGEIDFDNPHDGIRFTDISTNAEIHIKVFQDFLSTLIRTKEICKTCGLTKLSIEILTT